MNQSQSNQSINQSIIAVVVVHVRVVVRQFVVVVVVVVVKVDRVVSIAVRWFECVRACVRGCASNTRHVDINQSFDGAWMRMSDVTTQPRASSSWWSSDDSGIKYGVDV